MKIIPFALTAMIGLAMFIWSIISYRNVPKKLGPKQFSNRELAIEWDKAGYDVEVATVYRTYRGEAVVYRRELCIRCYDDARPTPIEEKILSVRPIGEHRWARIMTDRIYKSYAK